MSDIRIFAVGGLLMSGVLYGIYLAPPLVSSETSTRSAVDSVKFEAIFDEELDHCEAQPNDYDCQCYARLSGVVQSTEGLNVPGTQRIDRKQLARMQASGSC